MVGRDQSKEALIMAHKLFVGGLPYSTSNERLRELFAEVGQVESATVVTDRETGRSRGFGFVEMSTAEEAEQAVSRLNGQQLDGRRLQVEKAKENGGGGGGARRSGGGFGGGFNRSGGGSRGGRW
jgi:RNA recognition motif-containing protein